MSLFRSKNQKKFLLLDIDGVLLPFTADPFTHIESVETPEYGTLYARMDLIAYLKSLSPSQVEIWIASSWQEEGVRLLKSGFGIDCAGYIAFDYSSSVRKNYRWPKQPALERFFAAHPHEKIVVVDDAGRLYQGNLPRHVKLIVPDSQVGAAADDLRKSLED